MTVRAKMNCVEVKHFATGSPDGTYAQVTMMPVYNDGPENETWSKYTPSGRVEMCITNPDAVNSFEQGKRYYVDFSPAD